MPTYEYRCAACGHDFERFQKINDPPVRTCPECGSKDVEKQISSGAGLLFKGPGFYATDYRSPRREKKREKGSAGPEGKKAGGSGGDAAT
jgi:putative FmdB family regulatory protein